MYRRSGLLILIVLCIIRLDFINGLLDENLKDTYCRFCQQQNRGCIQSSCTPHCLPGYEDDGEGNCIKSQDTGGWDDISSQDNAIDRIALTRNSKSNDNSNAIEPQVSDFSNVDTKTGERWQKPILTDQGYVSSPAQKARYNYRTEPRVMSVSHDNDATINDKVSSVVRAADTLEALPPQSMAMRADPNGPGAMEGPATMGDVYFLMLVAGCSVIGLVGLVVAGVCWYRMQKNVKATSEAEYPAYGVTGPTKERTPSPGDRKLAQSAQMYHYQHQKQQMLALEKANNEVNQEASDEDSEEENEEGNYTVYECPGLATTGEMEVKNPMFEETPVNPQAPEDTQPEK